MDSPTHRLPRAEVVCLVVALILVALAPTGQTLWSDEGHSARFIATPNLVDVFSGLALDVNSQAQMPGYFLYGWAAGKVFGYSEWALRLPNILWGWLAVFAFFFLGRRFRAPFLPLLLAVSPFFCYYLDEVRPYAMQIGGAALICCVIARLAENRDVDMQTALAWLAGGWLLSISSMLGAFPFGAATLVAGWMIWRRRLPFSKPAVAVIVTCYAVLVLVGIYYLWSILRGAAGAKLWSVGLSNVVFAFYELLGFSGLGPGRFELREAAWQGTSAALAILGAHGVGLAGLALFLAAAVLVCLGVPKGTARAFLIPCLVIVIVGTAALVAAAAVVKFPFWGRHLSPLLPFLVAILGIGIANSRFPGVLRVAAFSGLAAFWLLSSLNLRFAERHGKDNYRAAAAFTKQQVAAGNTVWWIADDITGGYYKVPLGDDATAQHARFLFMPAKEAIDPLPPPRFIVLGRPSQFDRLGSVREYLAAHGFQKTTEWIAFTVWERPQ